jgi:uncharacterized membrane protein
MVRWDIIDLVTGAKRHVSCRELFRNFNIALTRYTKGVYYTGIKLFSSIPPTIRYLNHTSIRKITPTLSKDLPQMTVLNLLKQARERCIGAMKNCFFDVTLSVYIDCDSITVFQWSTETLQIDSYYVFQRVFYLCNDMWYVLGEVLWRIYAVCASCFTVIYSKQLDVCILIVSWLDFWYSITKKLNLVLAFQRSALFLVTRWTALPGTESVWRQRIWLSLGHVSVFTVCDYSLWKLQFHLKALHSV